jgi:hypothetical protein
MKGLLLPCALLLTALSSAGCYRPTTDITITSVPSGVAISMNGRCLGKTPITSSIDDIPGMGSRYEFKAEKPGFVSELRVYREKGLRGPRGCMGPRIMFHLKPQE